MCHAGQASVYLEVFAGLAEMIPRKSRIKCPVERTSQRTERSVRTVDLLSTT